MRYFLNYLIIILSLIAFSACGPMTQVQKGSSYSQQVESELGFALEHPSDFIPPELLCESPSEYIPEDLYCPPGY